jgi:hypothetical protein
MRTCLNCGTSIEHKRAGAKFCSDSCKVQYSNKNKDSNNLPTTTSVVDYTPVATKTAMALVPRPLGDATAGLVQHIPQMSNSHLLAGAVGLALGLYASPKLIQKPTMIDYVVGGAGGALLGALAYWIIFDRIFVQPEPTPTLMDSQIPPVHNVILGSEIQRNSNAIIQFNSPILGRIGSEFNIGFKLLIHGQAGNGKSTIAAQITRELLPYGRVLYVLSEESLTSSVQKRINEYGLNNNSVAFLETNDIRSVYNALETRQYNFIVIDSISSLLPSYDEQVRFINLLQGFNLLGQIIIVQETKGGQMRGSNELHHAGDVTLNVMNFDIYIEKNRFGQTGISFSPKNNKMQSIRQSLPKKEIFPLNL